MAFDECPPSQSPRAYHEESLARTTRWARRCKETWLRHDPERRHALFGIVQGGLLEDLRERHAGEIAELDLPGIALGGFSVGKSRRRCGKAWAAPPRSSLRTSRVT